MVQPRVTCIEEFEKSAIYFLKPEKLSQETTIAVCALANEKLSALDDLPVEWYEFFWTDIEQTVAKTVH